MKGLEEEEEVVIMGLPPVMVHLRQQVEETRRRSGSLSLSLDSPMNIEVKMT